MTDARCASTYHDRLKANCAVYASVSQLGHHQRLLGGLRSLYARTAHSAFQLFRGINRVDLKGKRQGRWVERIDNVRGERGFEEQGFYLNGQKEGQWQRFTLEGDLIAIENYKWGYKNGKCVYMSPMGDPLREES